jgi:uncharacterized protein YbbC (DUF1343 family)
VRFVLTDRETYRPVRTALVFIDLVRRMHPNDFTWQERGAGVDRLAGSDALRKAIAGNRLQDVLAAWDRDAESFLARRREFLVY